MCVGLVWFYLEVHVKSRGSFFPQTAGLKKAACSVFLSPESLHVRIILIQQSLILHCNGNYFFLFKKLSCLSRVEWYMSFSTTRSFVPDPPERERHQHPGRLGADLRPLQGGPLHHRAGPVRKQAHPVLHPGGGRVLQAAGEGGGGVRPFLSANLFLLASSPCAQHFNFAMHITFCY